VWQNAFSDFAKNGVCFAYNIACKSIAAISMLSLARDVKFRKLHCWMNGSMKQGDDQMKPIETISDQDQVLCVLIDTSHLPECTTFLTPADFKQQVGFVVYPAGGEVSRHVHMPLERHLVGTSEVILVMKGHCLLDIYNDRHELITTRELDPGDLMLMVGGGHGFRMMDDTVLLEIKQGPYTGVEEKELF
jgi:hypothetical protein